ncbi:MAG: hypothetical protein R3C59_18670 [Planctomycetaceae bacterium]
MSTSLLVPGDVTMPEFEQITELPLGERLRKADYLVRELSEHLRQAYIPRVGELRSASKQYDPETVSDQRILDHTLAVLEAEEFTEDLYGRLRECLDSIRAEMTEMLFGSRAEMPSLPQVQLVDEDGLFGD